MKRQEDLDRQIDATKATIRKFITDENIPSFEEDSQQSQQGLQELQRMIAETSMDLSLIKSQRVQIDAKLQGRLEASQDDIRKAEADPSVMQLSRDINDLSISIQSKKSRFGAMHPEVRSGEQNLESAIGQKKKSLPILSGEISTDNSKQSPIVKVDWKIF